jgi:hypothetical protein
MRGGRVLTYSCRRLHPAGDCPAPESVQASLIEPHVVGLFFERLGGEAVADAAAGDGAGVEDALVEVEEAEAELVAYLETSAVRELGRELFERGVQARRRARDEARTRLADAQEHSTLPAGLTPGDIREAWAGLTVRERRTLLAAVIDVVVVRSSGRRNVPVEFRAAVLWRGEGPSDLPRPGRPIGLRPIVEVEWAEQPNDVRVAVA